jgi:hypothetical protein
MQQKMESVTKGIPSLRLWSSTITSLIICSTILRIQSRYNYRLIKGWRKWALRNSGKALHESSISYLLTVLFHVQCGLMFVPPESFKILFISKYEYFGGPLATVKRMCEPNSSKWACSPNNHRLGTVPNKKIFPGPLIARWELGVRQNTITCQVY